MGQCCSLSPSPEYRPGSLAITPQVTATLASEVRPATSTELNWACTYIYSETCHEVHFIRIGTSVKLPGSVVFSELRTADALRMARNSNYIMWIWGSSELPEKSIL